MKHNQNSITSEPFSDHRRIDRRRELARLPRCLIILLVLVLLAASALAAYGRFRPIILPIPMLAYRYERQSEIQYQIQNEPSPIMDQTMQGMDLVYLSEYARAVLPVFTYRFTGDRIYDMEGQYQMIGLLRLRDQSDPGQILFEKIVPLSEQTPIRLTGRELLIEQSVQVSLQEFYDLAREFEQESDLRASYELEVGMQVALNIRRGTNTITAVQERPALVLPLGEETFTVRTKPLEDQREQVWLTQKWQLLLTPLPIWVYPIASGLCLLALVLLLVTTRPRKKMHFNRQLRKMLRKTRGRLMIIGDKAWEPEWCISVTSFRTMVRTARKLKHPIFCFIERDSDQPIAYFYVYYGENNYCYTFTGVPDKHSKRKKNKSGSEPLTGNLNPGGGLTRSPAQRDEGFIRPSLPEQEPLIEPTDPMNRTSDSGPSDVVSERTDTSENKQQTNHLEQADPEDSEL